MALGDKIEVKMTLKTLLELVRTILNTDQNLDEVIIDDELEDDDIEPLEDEQITELMEIFTIQDEDIEGNVTESFDYEGFARAIENEHGIY